jgi:hypothetical protein
MKRRFTLALALTTVALMGAEFRTPNFIVISANQQVCKQMAEWAEHYRKEKAIQWLGREMPNWPEPCPLRVNVTMEPPSGETEFTFGGGRVTSQRMTIRGPLERLIYSVLPHEVTHTVFAHHFKQPVPRWADEGGSVLSEDDTERDRHDKSVRAILNKGQQIPMRTLLSLREYPPQVVCLYAQGYSMCDFLVKRSNRQHFLNFVGAGMQQGWDNASKSYYGHANVEELEQAWLKHLRDTKGQSHGQQLLAANPGNNANVNAASFAGNPATKTVRMTVPPAQPLDPQGIARAVMGGNEPVRPSMGQPTVRLEPPVPLMTPLPTPASFTRP